MIFLSIIPSDLLFDLLTPLTASMTAQTQSMGHVAVLRKIGQKIFLPAPRAVKHGMHEQDWRVMCI